MKTKKSNIEIVKNYLSGERPFTQVGYTGKRIKRKDGDQWTDKKGIKWEQKNGFKVRVNEQANLIRELTEQKCKCGQQIKWGDKFDRLFYNKTGLCYECIIKEETNLRILGLYPLYERKKLLSNYLGSLKTVKEKVEETIKYFENNDGEITMLCNSDGVLEKFIGTNRNMILEDARKDLKEIDSEINIVSKDYEKTKTEFEEAVSKLEK